MFAFRANASKKQQTWAGQRMIRVIGIDPGLRNLGWGVIDVVGNRMSHVANGVCHSQGDDLAARLLSKLNRKELAWNYLTTPLAGRSGESSVWKSLAENLASQRQVDLADMAYLKAFELEQTNPEILLAHAKLRLANGRPVAGQGLLHKIVDSNWQPRFNRVVQEAKGLLP